MAVARPDAFSSVSSGAGKQLAAPSSSDMVGPINFAVKWCGATAAKDSSMVARKKSAHRHEQGRTRSES
jgi:hypothetical protein